MDVFARKLKRLQINDANYFGKTFHYRCLKGPDYPYDELV